MAMSKYETIIWEDKMKERIMSLARARYTSDFESGSVFDIIHTTVKHGNSTSYDTHLIVYESPSTNEVFQFLITMQCNSFAQGLEALMSRIQAQLGRSIKKAREDKLRDESEYGNYGYDSDGDRYKYYPEVAAERTRCLTMKLALTSNSEVARG